MPKGLASKKTIFITGTDTSVGKTVITAGLLAVFQKRGHKTVAVKPFQTGACFSQGELLSPDVMFYREAGLLEEPPEVLNPVSLEPPAAPWVASIISETPIDVSKVYQTVENVLQRYDVVLLEGAGGLCVPVRKDFLMADLVRELGCPVLVVARGALGTINHTLLTVSYARACGIPVLGMVINGIKPGEDRVESYNPRVIKELTGVPLLGTVPFSSLIDVDKREVGDLVELIETTLDFNVLEGAIFGKS